MPSPNADTDANPRDIYLLQTLGLEHDPFAYATAELELQINSDDPPFLTYFVDLPAADGEESLLEALQQPGHAVVYGEVGSGKTTLRYALEAQCRGLAQQVLVVSEELGKSGGETAVPTLQTFTQALATDLFVQTIERFDTLPAPDTSLTTALSRFWQQNIPNFHRNVTRHLRQGQSPNTPTGISPWWRTWKRVVVRYTPLTKARKQFLEQVLALGKEKREKDTAVAPTAALQQGISLAHRLGFQQLYYLIDAADTPELNITTLLNHLNQINDILPDISSQTPLSLKLFLPQRIQAELQTFLSRPENRLISPSFSAIIQWSYSLLHTLIENRFRSAGSWIRGIEVLVSQESPVKLESELIKSAQQSPRRLLQILSLLINTHVDRTAVEPTFTGTDLQKTLHLWLHDAPSLPPSIVNHVINEGILHA